MHVFAIDRFERFFRTAADLDVDKSDLNRVDEFVHRQLFHLLLIGQITAEANDRDIIEPHDLPITKGLQENIHVFRKIDQEITLTEILARLTTYPPLTHALSAETEARLPAIAGGLTVALARTFGVVDPKLRNPSSEDWKRMFRLFNLLL